LNIIPGLMTKEALFNLDRDISREDAEQLRLFFSNSEGVESYRQEKKTVTVVFYPEILSLSTISAHFSKLGYSLVRDDGQRHSFTRFIRNLAESNKKTFGSERLDCCTIKSKFKRY
jgi:hypothetical protein